MLMVNSAFECPSCKAGTNKLIIFNEPKRLGCPNCGSPKSKPINPNLGQTLDRWEHVDKKGIVHKHRLSVGKDYEISNRAISRDDGKTVINSKTGRPSDY